MKKIQLTEAEVRRKHVSVQLSTASPFSFATPPLHPQAGAGCGVCLIKPWTKEGLIGSANYDYQYLCMPS